MFNSLLISAMLSNIGCALPLPGDLLLITTEKLGLVSDRPVRAYYSRLFDGFIP